MQITRILLGCLCLWSGITLAQTQFETGRAAVNYTGKSAPQSAKDQASQMAETKAIETHYANAGQNEFSNFEAIRDKILGNLDRYVLEAVVVSEEDHTDTKQ